MHARKRKPQTLKPKPSLAGDPDGRLPGAAADFGLERDGADPGDHRAHPARHHQSGTILDGCEDGRDQHFIMFRAENTPKMHCFVKIFRLMDAKMRRTTPQHDGAHPARHHQSGTISDGCKIGRGQNFTKF